MKDKTIAVWFSCGAASATAAKLTIEKYGKNNNVIILNNPILEEDKDNIRFLKDCEKWLGCKIESVKSSKFPNQSCVEVWEKRKYMSGIKGAPCTMILKKQARQEWENKNHVDWHVLGFTEEEKSRHINFVMTERENVLPILIDEKMTKLNCYQFVKRSGIELSNIYKKGYPNANCIGCVKATSPTYWNHVRNQNLKVFNERAEQSKRLGVRLVRVKGKRIFLHELKKTDKGRSMKNMDFECGIFCEEHS